MADEVKKYIRQIKDSEQALWDIYASKAELADNSEKLGGATLSTIEASIAKNIEDARLSAVETYVVTKDSSAAGYSGISDFTITLASLQADCNTSNSFNVGDVVLNKTTNLPDWWVSNISGTTITLSPLETQSIDHKHSITRTSGSAIATVTTTSVQVAKVGAGVGVATGELVSTDTWDGTVVVTSVVNQGTNNVSGSVTTTLATGTSDDYGHSHTVTEHSHSGSYAHTIVSETEGAYTSLTTAVKDIHTHTSVDVAGPADNGEKITYVNGSNGSATFIKTLTSASTTTSTGTASPSTDSKGDHTHTIVSGTVVVSVDANTGDKSLTTDANTAALSTNAPSLVTATIVSTGESGAHTHSVSGSTESVVKTFSVDTVSSNGTGFISGGSTTDVLTSVTPNVVVDASGILSFGVATTSVSAYTGLSTKYMHFSSGNATISGTAASDGAHKHNMNHSHTIDSHTHGIAAHNHSIGSSKNSSAITTESSGAHTHTVNSHSHTYYGTVASATESAITGLATGSFTPHSHTNVSVANVASGSVSVVTGGDKTTKFIKTLKDEDKTLTTGAASVNTTSTAYIKATSTPSLTVPGVGVGLAKLSTTTITPAAAGETVITSVSTTPITVITSVSDKTGGKTV